MELKRLRSPTKEMRMADLKLFCANSERKKKYEFGNLEDEIEHFHWNLENDFYCQLCRHGLNVQVLTKKIQTYFPSDR